MKNLTILNTQIRTLDNLYSLTDFHKASGSEAKHKPALFLSNQQTKDLILEIENSKVGNPTLAVKTIRGGRNPSTYACLEIVIAYAAWISAEFHLKVIRAFMALNGIGTHPQQIALPEPEKTFSTELTEYELQTLVWLWIAVSEQQQLIKHLNPALQQLGSSLAPTAHSLVAEFRHIVADANQLLNKLTQDIPLEPRKDNNWTRSLPRLRQFADKQPNRLQHRHPF
ncbi:P22AR C-terminal domain-containing protein [Gallibacterium anatis]|uniref:P22AR C-terminal domain-containing protein n=4 Tax=Gallibacterium anatis TaxID=750 RepID=UPI0030058617